MERESVLINRKNKLLTGSDILKKRRIILLACIVGSINVFFYNNYLISTIVVLIQIIILGYCFFIKKSVTDYIGYYLIFLSLSLEFVGFTGNENLYGFKDFRILGVNLGILMLLPVLLKLIFRGANIKKIKSQSPKLMKFSSIIIFLSFTGLLFGLFQILINDNNIQNMWGFIGSFINTSYNMMAIPILLIAAYIYIFSWEDYKINNLNVYLTSVLFGTVFMLVTSLIFSRAGTYGGVSTLIVSNTVIYIPFIFILSFRENVVNVKIYYILGIVGVALSLLYNASGKLIILSIIGFLYFYKELLRTGKLEKKLIATIAIPFLVSLAIYTIDLMKRTSIIFSSKINQAVKLLLFWKPEWFLDLPTSPRVRVVQFINISIEYLKKPWFALMGKGYMGTFRDHINGFNGIQNNLGAFSIDQWNNGTFYRPHETLNVIFLYHGLLGLSIYIFFLFFVIKNSKKSPWLLIGGIWFLLFYGYSITLSAFGMAALLFGLYELDMNNKK